MEARLYYMIKIYKNLKRGLGFLSAALISLNVHSQSPIITDPFVEELSKVDFQFLEGPLWVDSLGLLFSDIPANKIYRWNTATNQRTIFLTPSGNSNGLKVDINGNLLLAQHGNRRVARIINGVETPVASAYKGKLLNSPNDIAVKSSGSIFFTDPNYGLAGRTQEIPFEGVYRVNTKGLVRPIDSTIVKPNGIAFSPDEKKLYVNASIAKIIYSYDVVNDSTFTNKQVFATMTGTGNADGMVVDANGYVYTTGPGGIWVYAPDKSFVRTITVPGQNTNVTIGNRERNALYVTTSNAIHRITNRAPTGLNDLNSAKSSVSPLVQNYPNPVSNSTNIPLNLNTAGFVNLEVLNAQGHSVATITSQNLSAGSHIFNWESGSNPDGSYLIKLTFNNKVYSKYMILSRK